MIRYDVLWHDLMRDLYEKFAQCKTNADTLEDMNAHNTAQANRQVARALCFILNRANEQYEHMKEKDETERHNANLTLQEILQELKKLNKGKEDEEDGELDRKGDDPGSETSGEQTDNL